MTPFQALKHFVTAAVAGFPVFLLVTYWGRTPRLVWFAAGFAVMWGGVSVWMRAATIVRDQQSMLRPGWRDR